MIHQDGAISARFWQAAYPPGVPVQVDLASHTTATALLLERLRTHADRPHCRLLGCDVTYGALDQGSRAFAAWLQSRGLVAGDRIAIMLPNCPQYPLVVFAALRLRLVIVNVNPLYTARELRNQLVDSGASAIVVLENFASVVQAVLPDTGLKLVVTSGLADLLPAWKRWPVHAALRWIKKAVPVWQLPQAVALRTALQMGAVLPLKTTLPQRDEVAVLQYTGGTTGVAKGAMLTQANLLASLLTLSAWLQPLMDQAPVVQKRTMLLALPMYHVYGFVNCMLLSTVDGGLLVLVPNARDTAALMRTWARQPVHMFAGINTLYNAVLNVATGPVPDYAALRYCGAGGASTQASVAERWHARTGQRIYEGFGMSETSSACCCNPWQLGVFNGTAGVPLPGMDACVLDADDQPLPAGERGELCVRGPFVMKGYWNRPDETRAAFTADGYLRTGDIAEFTAEGFLRIVDRKKDMILVSGFNVFPNEIEEVLASHPAVLECAVVGRPDPVTGEAVLAVVVLRQPGLPVAELQAFCRQNLTGYKRPQQILVRDTLPKSPIGKILRRELRQQLQAEQVD